MYELIQKLRNNKKETRKKLQMKMRPLRVKVRKPIVEEEEIGNLPDPMDETFGLKEPESNGDLVLEPTPAVPGSHLCMPPCRRICAKRFQHFLHFEVNKQLL